MSQSGEKGKVSNRQKFHHITVITLNFGRSTECTGGVSNKAGVIKIHGTCNLMHTCLHRHPEGISCINASVSWLGFIACWNFSMICIIINLTLIHSLAPLHVHLVRLLKMSGRSWLADSNNEALKCRKHNFYPL